MTKNKLFILACLLFAYSCKKDAAIPNKHYSGLAKYLNENKSFGLSNQLIACAASQSTTEVDYNQYPIAVYFYPIAGAYEYKYFETSDINVDILDYSKFIEKQLPNEAVFNGYLRRFKNNTIAQDVWGIVTYKVGTTIHVCRGIHIKHYTKPTQYDPSLLTIQDSLTFPKFSWNDGVVAENVIYFEVVSDTLNNLISGTYTYDKYFKFYDLSNVVLNIHDVTPHPTLISSTKYNFTMMGVSHDNWVNLICMKPFTTQ
ncbi:MAG: hypothetical protein HY062_13595 [Bacteroidetes bacterium]|nr:hypothetical protein [Bacteroidota bacterium]